jgi:hypothetical protein
VWDLLTGEQYILGACGFCLQNQFVMRLSKTKQRPCAWMKEGYFIRNSMRGAFVEHFISRELY